MIGFAVLPNDDESVKWLDFLYWKSPTDPSEDLKEAIHNAEFVKHAEKGSNPPSSQKMKEE